MVATGGAFLLTVIADAVVAFLGAAFLSTLLTKLYYEHTDLHVAAPTGDSGQKGPELGVRRAETWLRPRRALPLIGLALAGSRLLLRFGELAIDDEAAADSSSPASVNEGAI